MIVVTVFEPNGNFIRFKNCHHDHIPFTVKGMEIYGKKTIYSFRHGNIVFSAFAHAHSDRKQKHTSTQLPRGIG